MNFREYSECDDYGDCAGCDGCDDCGDRDEFFGPGWDEILADIFADENDVSDTAFDDFVGGDEISQ